VISAPAAFAPPPQETIDGRRNLVGLTRDDPIIIGTDSSVELLKQFCVTED